jgi:hypothetical protein
MELNKKKETSYRDDDDDDDVSDNAGNLPAVVQEEQELTLWASLRLR